MKYLLLICLVYVALFEIEANPTKGFGMRTAPKKQPDICYQPKKTGPCRARFERYYFNKKTGECTEFVYGGCHGNGNRFVSMAACQDACRPEKVIEEEKPPQKAPQNCSFDVDVLKSCELTSRQEDMTICNKVPVSSDNKTECLNAGCCWHPTFQLCHQVIERKILNNRCTILYQGNDGFIGYASFQSPIKFIHGWMGYLTFGNAVTGQFCVGRRYAEFNMISAGQRLANDTFLTVQGNKSIYPGQVVPFVFTGTYKGSAISKDHC